MWASMSARASGSATDDEDAGAPPSAPPPVSLSLPASLNEGHARPLLAAPEGVNV